MEKDIDIDKLLSENKFNLIVDYLRDNIQFDGALHNYDYILNRATHESFNSSYYIDYLKNKYKNLYNL